MADSEKKMMRRRLAGSYVSSVVSIALVLLLLGAAALLLGAARSVTDYFKESMQMSVILKQGVDEQAADLYREKIDVLPFVKSSRTVSREEGTREMQEMLGEDFLSVFKTAPIPVSVEVSLKAAWVCADSLDMVRTALADPVVDEISYQQSLIEKLGQNVGRISVVLGVFILLLLFVSFVLIGNTVRLDVYSRRFTIHTMAMVGATRAFIRRPFLARSVLQGLAAAVLGMALLAGALYLLWRSFPAFGNVMSPLLLVGVALGLTLTGVLICIVSTAVVVNGIVSLEKGKLYY